MAANFLLTTLTGLGIIWATHLLYRLTRFIHIYTRPSSLPRYHHGPQPWALITGATNGIGLSYAHELASQGFNIILHGRNPTKLSSIASSLRATFPALNFRTVVADAFAAGDTSHQAINTIVDTLQGLNITVLVNNVGGGELPDGLTYNTCEKTSGEDVDRLLNLNARFPAQITRAAMPLLLKNEPSLVLNMGSVAQYGSPWLSIYSGAKAFNMAWSTSLRREMLAEGRDVEVLGIMTASVTQTGTVLRHDVAPSMFEPDARAYARSVLARVGCGRNVVAGYWAHAVTEWLMMSVLPDFIARAILATKIRERAAVELTIRKGL